MNTELKDLDNCKKELTVVLPFDELSPYFEKAVNNFRDTANIPGFRKGKIPMDIIRKRYLVSIEYSELENIINEIFKKYIDENNIDLLGSGKITKNDYKRNESFEFKIEFEVKPVISIENYKNLELTRVNYIIDDSLIDEEIDYYRKRMASRELDGQAFDDDYVLTVDFQYLDEKGNIIIGDVSKDKLIYLNDESLLPELRTGLKNMKENEEREIELKDDEGKLQKVKILCKKVEKLIYPEINNDFFKKITKNDKLETEEEYKNLIKQKLINAYERIADEKIKSDLINELIRLNDVEVPESFIEKLLDNMLNDFKSRFPKDFKFEDSNEKEFRKERRVDAILQLKWFFIKNKIIESEKISVADEDFQKLAEKNSEKYNIPVDKLIEAYKNKESIKDEIKEIKLFEFLFNNAKITVKEEIKKSKN